MFEQKQANTTITKQSVSYEGVHSITLQPTNATRVLLSTQHPPNHLEACSAIQKHCTKAMVPHRCRDRYVLVYLHLHQHQRTDVVAIKFWSICISINISSASLTRRDDPVETASHIDSTLSSNHRSHQHSTRTARRS